MKQNYLFNIHQKTSFYFLVFCINLFFIFPQKIKAQTEEIDTIQTQKLLQFQASEIMGFEYDAEEQKVTTASKNAESIKNAPAVITSISNQEIEGYGYTSLLDVLDRITSTYITGSYFQTNSIVSIRGNMTSLYNTHVLVLMDGRPVRESMFAGFNTPIYGSIPMISVERIEVIRGPGSVLYGTGAFSGVINIIMKKGKAQENTAKQVIGSFGTRLSVLGLGYTKKSFNISASIRAFETDGWDFEALDFDGEKITGKSFEKNLGATLNMSYKNFTYSGYYGQSIKPIFAEPRFEIIFPSHDMNNVRMFHNLGYDGQFSEKWRHSTNFTYNHYRFLETEPVARLNNAKGYHHFAYSNDFLLEHTQYINPIKNLNITFGGTINIQTGKFEQSHRNTDGSLYAFDQGLRNPNPNVGVAQYSDTWYNAYLQVDYSFLDDKLKLVGGGQYNHTSINEAFVPRVALIYNLNNHWNIKALYGEAFRANSRYEGYSLENDARGNRNLKPEKTATFEGEIGYHTKRFNAKITYFNDTETDLIGLSNIRDSLYIDPTTQESIPVYLNRQKLKSQGLEFEGRYVLNKNFSFNGNFTLQEVTTDIIDEDTRQTIGTGYQVTGIPDIMAKFGFLYRIPKKGFSLGVFNSYFGGVKPLNRFESDFDIREENERQNFNGAINAYHHLSFNTSLDLKTFFELDNIPRINISLFVQNALDAKVNYADYNYTVVDSVPGRAGRTFYGAISVKF